jgi:selenocysteine lyase/cysteine desulfurase
VNLDRKTFLRHLGTGTLGLAAATRLPGSEPAARAEIALPAYRPEAEEAFWDAVRRHYSIAEDLTYLNCGGLGPSPGPVLRALEETATTIQRRVEAAHGLFDDARRVLAGFLGAKADELCFTRNATEGNSIVAAGLDLRGGDEVIFESHAHPGGSLPWLNQARQRGVVVRVFAPDASSPEGNVQRIAALLTPRTRVVQVSHVTAPMGLVMPVKAIAALCRERGLWFHIDGAQSAGMSVFSLREIGCDSYATSGHKWLGGPRETGLLYLREERVEEVAPSHVGAYSSADFDFHGRLDYARGARRHEYGTRNAAAAVGLAEAARFQEAVGRGRIAALGARLAWRLQEGLRGLPGVTVLTPRDAAMRASMTTFTLAGASAETVFTALLKRHGLRCRPVTEDGLQAVRVSAHLFNTAAEMDRVVAAVGELAKGAGGSRG